jgi:hypothetical protein
MPKGQRHVNTGGRPFTQDQRERGLAKARSKVASNLTPEQRAKGRKKAAETMKRRRLALASAHAKRAASRPLGLAAAMKGEPDPVTGRVDAYTIGNWLGDRVHRYRELLMHPLFKQIHGKLVVGLSPYVVADWIRSRVPPDDPLGTDNVKRDSLIRRLYRYRNVLPKALFLEPTYIDTLVKGAELDIDVMTELDALIVYQKDRINNFAEREKTFPIPLDQQRKEVMALADLLKQRRDTSIALGYTPGILPGVVQIFGGDRSEGDELPQESRMERYLADNPLQVGPILELMSALEEIPIQGEYVDVTPPKAAAGEDEKAEPVAEAKE